MSRYETVSAVIAGSCAFMQMTEQALALGERQHRAQIEPVVSAKVQPIQLQGVHGYRGVTITNGGAGTAYAVRTRLLAARADGKQELVERREPDLGPHNTKTIAAPSGTNDYQDVWGLITYRDVEGIEYWSRCEQGSAQWEHGRGCVPPNECPQPSP